MEVRKIASIYSSFIGIAMLGMWSMLLTTDQVPELEVIPVEMTFHILAEVLTAIALLIGGIGLFTGQRWGFRAYLVSMGSLFYALMMAMGYYAQRGDMAMIGMFSLFLLLMTVFLSLSFIRKEEFGK